MTMENSSEIRPTTITRHYEAIAPAIAMLAGMQLDVFTPLQDRPSSPEALARVLGFKESKLSPLLYALVLAGLLNVEDGIFSNTKETGRFLVRGEPDYMGGGADFTHGMYQAIMKTAETIRTGEPQAKLDWSALDDNQLLGLFRSYHPGALWTGEKLASMYDLKEFRHLLDAGGGSGGVAIGLCESCQYLHATVLDLPTVVPETRRFVSESNMSDRIDVAAADLTTDMPEEMYDLAVLRYVLQTKSPEHAKAILRNVCRSIQPKGMVLVVGSLVDDTRLHPKADASVRSLLMLNNYDDGQAYAENDLRGWLVGAGFSNVSVDFEAIPDKSTVVTARKV